MNHISLPRESHLAVQAFRVNHTSITYRESHTPPSPLHALASHALFAPLLNTTPLYALCSPFSPTLHTPTNPPPKSIIVRAQGEARSAELLGDAMRQNKGFLELRRLEAARDIANLLATSGNKVMLDSESLLLNGE